MGLSFGEILVLAILALVVIGPKDLPKLLRMAGRLIGQAKRAVADVRRETGLDDVLRGDFQDLERLADHIENLEPYKGEVPRLPEVVGAAAAAALREREYPPVGADAHGLLPDDAPVYMDTVSYDAPESMDSPTATPVIEVLAERDLEDEDQAFRTLVADADADADAGAGADAALADADPISEKIQRERAAS